MLITLNTEDIGETPSSACFVNATPTPQKNRQNTNKIYLLINSFFDIYYLPFHFMMNQNISNLSSKVKIIIEYYNYLLYN